MGLGVVGLKVEGLAEGGLRLRVPSLVVQGVAEVVCRPGRKSGSSRMALRYTGVASACPPGTCLWADCESDAEVVVYARASSGRRARALRQAASASAAPLAVQGEAEVAVRRGGVGPQGDGLAVGGLRRRVLLLARAGRGRGRNALRGCPAASGTGRPGRPRPPPPARPPISALPRATPSRGRTARAAR